MTTKMKRLAKCFYAVCVTVFVIGFASIPVRAETTDEIEPNDTMEMAQSIMANSETASEFINGTFYGQHIIKGYTSVSDEDWFVVYLRAGDNYLTCNCSTFLFEIIASDGAFVQSGTYLSGGGDMEAFRLNISRDDYYYVKITGVASTPREYLFLIGGPTYLIASNEIKCSPRTIKMTSRGRTQEGIFDGRSVSFPKDAVVSSVKMNGVRSYDVKAIKLSNDLDWHTLSLNSFTWDKKGIVGLNMRAASKWTAEFTYNKNTTFTPSLDIEYAYPVYSTPVDPWH